jgi:hypothetical protein
LLEHKEKTKPIYFISHSHNSEFTGQTLTEKRSGKTQGLFERTRKHIYFSFDFLRVNWVNTISNLKINTWLLFCFDELCMFAVMHQKWL